MKKLILLPILLLTSCAASTQNVIYNVPEQSSEETTPIDISNWTYTEPEEEAIVVTKEGVEVSSVEVIDIPRNGIKIACWDDYNIKIKVLYSDNSTETITFYEKYIPIEYRHFLGEIGHHTIGVCVNTSIVNFGFDIIKNDEFHGYTCNFFDYRFAEPELLDTKVVGYYENVTYSGVIPQSRTTEDIDVVETFVGWDHSLRCVNQDMIYKAKFRNVEKRFYGESLDDLSGMLITSNKKDEKYRTLSYLGRLHAVAFNYGETIHHEEGHHEEELTFLPLNAYGNRWSQMNLDMIEYGINYLYEANYGSYLYNTSGAFGESATVLNTFEAFYGGVSSHSKMLEDGLVDTSVAASFSNCYATAESYLTYTKTIEDNAESGYYRIALTMSFDVYVSTTFTKLTDNRYKLEAGAKFIFAPVIQTKAVRLEFSETSSFDNPHKKQLTFSTGNLYNVANNLDW